MRALVVELKKISAERASLACRRPDGSATWARVNSFFPLHDLTHFAVETELAQSRGFFGLIAEGWSLDEFTQPGVAARLPADALVVENLVGTIERVAAAAPLEEFSAALTDSLRAQQLPPFRALRADELARVHATRAALIAQWRVLAIGETLRLEFPLGA
jgi:hypothetical protein